MFAFIAAPVMLIVSGDVALRVVFIASPQRGRLDIGCPCCRQLIPSASISVIHGAALRRG